MDEKGAVLRSRSNIRVASIAGHFVFDKPYLLLLRRKGSEHPYFALWVNNPELLVPWKTK